MHSQTIDKPKVASQNNACTIQSITVTDTELIVKIYVPKSKDDGQGFFSCTAMIPSDKISVEELRKMSLDYSGSSLPKEIKYEDPFKTIDLQRQKLSEAGYLIKGLGKDSLDTFYTIPAKGRVFELHFNKMPADCKSVNIRELSPIGYEWLGVTIP
jgi:hypothetical protein